MTEPDAPASIVNDIWSAIQPETLWKGRTGKGVRVAVVDSGIDTEHPDLKGKVKESVEIVTVDSRLEFRPSTSGDQAGHGTACAGIIASVAPDAELYSVKVLGPQGSGSGEMFLVGLDYVIKQKFHVINLSLGTTKREYFAPVHDLWIALILQVVSSWPQRTIFLIRVTPRFFFFSGFGGQEIRRRSFQLRLSLWSGDRNGCARG